MERSGRWCAMAMAALGLCASASAGDDSVLHRREEVRVVSASKSEEALRDAPATISVVSAEDIAAAPSTSIGDLLRAVPGVNVVQTSARDINIATRQAASVLPSSQLALLDGRSIYLDFFGVILWDFVPSDASEIEQIEVVRGPASAVWGANAMTGVVNIVTKSPRRSPGTTLRLSGGLFDRRSGAVSPADPGGQVGLHVRHARLLNERWAMKVSASYAFSDAFARPSGHVPLDVHPLIPDRQTGGGLFTAYENRSTRQPKLDVRFDQGLAGGLATYAAGYAGTSGAIHSTVGPFDIQPGSYMAYGRTAYTRGRLKLSAFVNYVNAHAPNGQALDALSGEAVRLDFKQTTADVEVGHAALIGKHHLISYGGNVRHSDFAITLAPAARGRTEMGGYLHEEAFVGPLRFAAGGRVDRFGNLDALAFSPRLMAMWQPSRAHTLRLTYNKAFRAPAVVNNYLDLTIRGATLPLAAVCETAPALCAADPTLSAQVLGLGPRSMGSEVARVVSPAVPALRKESMSAYELSYSGQLDSHTTACLAAYVNTLDDHIDFAGEPTVLAAVGLPRVYSPRNPPPGWPFPVEVLGAPSLRAAVFDHVPATIAYLNLGPVRNRGVELSLGRRLAAGVRASLEYSWQDNPRPLTAKAGQVPFAEGELSVPAHHRLGVAVNVDRGRVIGSASASYVGRTYWNDVLPQLGFDGYTGPYTLVDACFGLRWSEGRVLTLVKGTNLLNREIRQHVFGDVQRIALTGEVRLSF